MSPQPRISILIPTYNYAHYLDEAIGSVLQQTFSDYEVIIVDNASTDNTDEVVQKYLVDPRFSYYKNSTNLGLVGNWNRCLSLAKGEYLKFLCADDKFHYQILEKFVAVMDQNPTVSLVTCFRQDFDGGTKIRKLPAGLHKGNDMMYDALHKYQYIGEPSSVMFRKRDLHIGYFNAAYKVIVDIEMYMRLMSVGDCYVIPEVLSYMRNHPNQISNMQKQYYLSTFEDYFLCKTIAQNEGYTIDTSTLNLDVALKKKSLKCAKVMYKVLPYIYKQKNQATFIRALHIAIKEKVIFSSLVEIIKRVAGKNLRLKSI